MPFSMVCQDCCQRLTSKEKTDRLQTQNSKSKLHQKLSTSRTCLEEAGKDVMSD